jgi:hypothetical protein
VQASLQLNWIATRRRETEAKRALCGATASTIGGLRSGGAGGRGVGAVGGSGRIVSERTSLAPLPISPTRIEAKRQSGRPGRAKLRFADD